jgi:hypothetical protein
MARENPQAFSAVYSFERGQAGRMIARPDAKSGTKKRRQGRNKPRPTTVLISA